MISNKLALGAKCISSENLVILCSIVHNIDMKLYKYCQFFVLALFLQVNTSAFASFSLVPRHPGQDSTLKQDFQMIASEANFNPENLVFSWREPSANSNTVQIICSVNNKNTKFELVVSSQLEERVSTLYYGLQKLGFLFPHPRWQISPTPDEMKSQCGKTFVWQARFRHRGFHLHTLHPSEWVHGFMMNQPQIAEETIRWHARNGQNILQIVLLEQDLDSLAAQLIPLVRLANDLGVSFGIDLSFEMIQQRMMRLVSPESKWRLFYLILFKRYEEKQQDIETNLKLLIKKLPFDFMTLELGTSEFTPSNYQQTIKRMNHADQILREGGKSLYIKIHSSVNQYHPELGNFNFLPSYAEPTVGVLPHTLMMYGLVDKKAPVYGRKDFKDMLEFTEREARVRPVWYYPETSYFIAMDIDVPLFLTDFLLTRSEDIKAIENKNVEGHLNFTTGHEVGYWLFDWNVALLANSEFKNEDAPALRLLKESGPVWERIISYQRKYYKGEHLIAELSSSNLLDELPLFNERTIDRHLLHELKKKPVILKERIELLYKAVSEAPDLSEIKNPELKILMEVTHLRLQHALFLRQALQAELEQGRDSQSFQDFLNQAERVRLDARKLMANFVRQWNRYPEASIFSKHPNLTSYDFGYGWTAGNLHFWEREEQMIRMNNYWPWFMQVINPLKIIF